VIDRAADYHRAFEYKGAMADFIRTVNVSMTDSSEESGDEDLARVEPADSMQGLIMSFNHIKPAPAPTIPDRTHDSPIQEDDEEEELERDVSNVGSLPDALPNHSRNHIKNSPSVDTMKILAGADSSYNMHEENHYESNAKRNEIALPSEPVSE
jgi:hypothetical protein